MDETLKKISDLLSRRREELQEHLQGSAVWESTTAELLDRVQRLKTRLNASVGHSEKKKK